MVSNNDVRKDLLWFDKASYDDAERKLLAKMCEYLNENLAIFIFEDLTEVSKRGSLPKLQSIEVKADKLNQKHSQIITIEDKESAGTKHIQCQKIVADGKKYTVRQVLENESSGESTSRVLTVEATLDPPGKASANESLSDEGKPLQFELVVTSSGVTVRNTNCFYRECRTGELFLGIDRGILACNISWGLGLVKFIFFFLAWIALTHDQSYFAARTVLGFLSLPIALISTIKRSIVLGIKYTKIKEMMALKKKLKEGEEKVKQMRQLPKKLNNFAKELKLKFLRPKDLILEISKLPYDQPERWPQLMTKSIYTISSVKYGCKVMTDETEMIKALDKLFEGTGITFLGTATA